MGGGQPCSKDVQMVQRSALRRNRDRSLVQGVFLATTPATPF